MFDGLKVRIIKESVFFERLRTLLYLSKNRKIEIWVVLLKPHQYIGSARVVSGVVRGIVSGTAAEPFHKLHIGGKFTFDDIESDDGYEFHNMDEVFAVSFHPIEISTLHRAWEKGYCLTRSQHLEASTALGGSHYYKILLSALDNDTT